MLLWFIFGYEFLSFIFAEHAGLSAIANSAHLGGMAGGLLCFILFNRISFTQVIRLRKKPTALPMMKYTVNMSEREKMQSELDKILDKINEQGFGALTQKEKDFLDQARDFFKK